MRCAHVIRTTLGAPALSRPPPRSLRNRDCYESHPIETPPREIRLELTRGGWECLESEAARQGIPFERLLEHAALSYLADLDSA